MLSLWCYKSQACCGVIFWPLRCSAVRMMDRLQQLNKAFELWNFWGNPFTQGPCRTEGCITCVFMRLLYSCLLSFLTMEPFQRQKLGQGDRFSQDRSSKPYASPFALLLDQERVSTVQTWVLISFKPFHCVASFVDQCFEKKTEPIISTLIDSCSKQDSWFSLIITMSFHHRSSFISSCMHALSYSSLSKTRNTQILTCSNYAN